MLRGLGALVAAADCPACARPFEGTDLCPECSDDLASHALDASDRSFSVGLGGVGPSLAVRAWAAYAGPVPALVGGFKFHGNRRLAGPLSARMAQRVDEDLTDFDVICAVPTHRARYIQRGFNPGTLLARSLAPPGTLPTRRLLGRRPGSAPQSQLSLEEREEAPFGLFEVQEELLGKVQGARVLLVDDVCTTGATLAASAQTLYIAGADWVEALVFARSLKGRASEPSVRDVASLTCL